MTLTHISFVYSQNTLTTFGYLAEFRTVRNAVGMVTGDFNGDGVIDLATYGGTKISIHLQEADSLSWRTFTFQSDRSLRTVLAARCNEDQLTDLITLTDEPTELRVFIAKPKDKFTVRWSMPMSWQADRYMTADIDNDGKIDLLMFGKKTLGVTVL